VEYLKGRKRDKEGGMEGVFMQIKAPQKGKLPVWQTLFLP
jgi:hypothetical protein